MITDVIPRHTPDESQANINTMFHELKIAFPNLPDALVHTLAVAGATLSEDQLQQILTDVDQGENKCP